MKKILLFTLLSLILLFSGCISIKKKLGITQESGPAIAQNEEDQTGERSSAKPDGVDASAYRQPIARPDGLLGRVRQKVVKDIEQLILPSYKSLQPEIPLPELGPIDPKKLVLEDKPVMINVDGMPLSDFITYAIGNIMKVTYFIDEAVKDIKTPITLRMAKKVHPETAFEIAIDILRQNGLTIGQRGEALHITKPKPESGALLNVSVGRIVPGSQSLLVQLVPLRHIKIIDIQQLIQDLYPNVKMKTYDKENAFIFTGTTTSIRNVINFINTVDVPYLSEKKLLMIQLTYWQPDAFIKQLTTILERIGIIISKSSNAPGVSFIPIKNLNSILVITPDDDKMKVVIEWKNKLDTLESAGTEAKAFTYRPLYSKASDLVDAIKSLYGIFSGANKNTGSSIVPGLKIGADDRRNLVVLIATPSAYKTTLSLLKELDTPPRQVLIETTVAELTLTGDLKYGLEWFLKNFRNKGPYEFSTAEGLGLGTSGLMFKYLSYSGKFQTMINAFAEEGRINILSKPRLMVLDNEQATIQVGDEISVITGEVTAEDITSSDEGKGPSVLRNFQYISTGMLLRVTPTINTEGLLTLDIAIELNEQKPKGGGNPDILTRRINTKVVVASGQSLILGGIMSEDVSETVNKVPLLGDLPFLGHLFKTTSKNKKKTELIITITPTILSSTDDAIKLTDEIQQGLKWLK